MKAYFKHLFGKKTADKPAAAHQPPAALPEQASIFRIHANGETHHADLPSMLAEALQTEGESTTREDDWLHHPATGYAFKVQLMDMETLLRQLTDENADRVQTTISIEIYHPTLFPGGCHEYQHSVAHQWYESIKNGLEQWLALDWPPLRDALLAPQASICSVMAMEFTAEDGQTERTTRIVLGNPQHFQTEPPEDHDEEHDFCPCCLFTQTLNLAPDDYLPLLRDEKTYAIRYFVSRDETGNISADCRINGEDWEAGSAALCAYAETWPPAGLEFRKQYVVLAKQQTD